MNGQDLKHRINGAKETVKITRAMQLVSASKMAKAEKRLEKRGIFLAKMFEVVKKMGYTTSPLSEKREVKKTAYVVIAGDKGLCGDYNHKILDYAAKEIENAPDPIVYPIGQVAREYFIKKHIKVRTTFIHLLRDALSEEVRDMAYLLSDVFLSGEFDEIYLVFTLINGKNVAKQTPCKVRLFPLDMPEQETADGFLEYQTDEDEILKQYIWAYIGFALCSAECSINYKSMTAMMSATNNGEELVESLARMYNHVRQEKITGELLDALNGNPKAEQASQ